MSKRCLKLTIEAELDEKEERVILKCPRSTKPPPRAMDCEQDTGMEELNIDELRAILKSAAKEEDLKPAAEKDST